MKHFLLILIIVTSFFSNAQPLHISNLGGSIPNSLFLFNSKLYFTSSFANNGNSELWVYDNNIAISSTNPKMLIDLDSASTGTFPRLYTAYNGKLFFNNNNGVYSYVDTLPISQTNPRYICPRAGGFTVYNGKLFIDVVPFASRTIWVFDDNLPVSITNPQLLVNQTLNPINTSNNFKPIVFQNKMFFSATNNTTTGEELWVYDSSILPSATNPSMLANINTNNTGNAANNGSIPSDFTIFNSKLYFSANDGTGSELFVYDGVATPAKVYDIDPNPYGGLAYNKSIYNGNLYFAGHINSTGTELWKYDGTTNPSLLADINAGSNYSIPSNLIAFGNRLIFNADNGINGRELFCYNGLQPVSSTNPFLVFDLNPGTSNGIISNGIDNKYIQYGNRLYFGASAGGTVGGLWALTLCDIGAASPQSFNLGNDTTINIGDTFVITGPTQMASYNWSDNSTTYQTSFIGNSGNIGNNIISLSIVDSNGCIFSDTVKVTVTNINSIPNIESEDIKISIYPNPTNGTINIISLNETDEIIVVNYLGQTVHFEKPNKKNISLSLENEGIYFLTVTSKNQRTTRKIIVSR